MSTQTNSEESVTNLPSALRTRKDGLARKTVSFPEEDTSLITGYLDPADPWEYARNVTSDEVLTAYTKSCEKHGTRPLKQVIQLLQKSNIDDEHRLEIFSLKGEPLDATTCETLEELLKRLQFKTLNVEGTALDDEGAVALFDMVEYYESATSLNISSNKNIGVRGWQACSRMIKKTQCLEELNACNVTLNEQYMPILGRGLRIGTHLQVLKLENCDLSGRPTILLASSLKLNTSLKELYLADNDLGVTDAIHLGGLLRANLTLQLLDISNNNIQDSGLGHISDGLIEQSPQQAQSPQAGSGLCILMLWNNHLTKNGSRHFARALGRSKSLEILNIGQNFLTNEILHVIKDSLQQNRVLQRLGMQSTHLTCEGATILAECLTENSVLKRIDLRDNNIQVSGLMALADSMKKNQSVTRIDLDDTPKRKLDHVESLEEYRKLVKEIRTYCERNEEACAEMQDVVTEAETTPERHVRLSSISSRKISLTCETLRRSIQCSSETIADNNHLLTEPKRGGRLRSPAPSPIPSPVSSPIPSPSRNRFQVSRVTENPHLAPSPTSSCSSSPVTPPSFSASPTHFFPSSSSTSSRFRVTLVEPSKVSVLPKPSVRESSNENITIGFSFKLNDTEIPDKVSQESTIKSSYSVLSHSSDSSSKISNSQEFSASHTVANIKSLVSENVSGRISPDSHCSDFSEDDLEVRQLMAPDSCKELSSGNFIEENPISNSSDSKVEVINVENRNLETASTQTDLKTGVKEMSEKRELNSAPNSKDIVTGNTSISEVSSVTKQRTRKISWISQEPLLLDQKSPSSLEKLLELFHHPSSIFSKAQPQYRATTVIVNEQPIPNSSASFLLAAGPLASAAKDVGALGSEISSRDFAGSNVPSSPEDELSQEIASISLTEQNNLTPDLLNNNMSTNQLPNDLSEQKCNMSDNPNFKKIEDNNFECISKSEGESENQVWCGEKTISTFEVSACDSNNSINCAQEEANKRVGSIFGVELKISQDLDKVSRVATNASSTNDKCDGVGKLCSNVMNYTPANGMSVTVIAQATQNSANHLDSQIFQNLTGPVHHTWPQTSKEMGHLSSFSTHLSMTSVRLVGGSCGFSLHEIPARGDRDSRQGISGVGQETFSLRVNEESLTTLTTTSSL